jgi:acyl-CoA dehydrogenase
MNAVDPLLTDSVARLLGATAAFDVIEEAEAKRWCAPVWDALAEAGFPWIGVPEDAGGSGGTMADAMAVLRAVGRHAAPVPLAETGVLAGWLSAAAGFDLPGGPCSVVANPSTIRLEGDRLVGEAVVAWAEHASRILMIVGERVASVRPDQVAVTPQANMAGEPRDVVRFDVAITDVDHTPAPAGVDQEMLERRGALTRVVLSAGALETLSQMTIDYAHARRQFGRPIAGFQAVQQHLVNAAQCAVRASMAADLATRAVEGGDGRFEVAAAKVVTDAAAVEAARAAHQAHGAMGVTREYPLHHFSRRLWAWRHEYGPERLWRRRLGTDAVARGADAFFATVTGTVEAAEPLP